MDELLLVAILVTTFNAIFDAVFVAWIAAKRSPAAFNEAAKAGKLKPAIDVIAAAAKEQILSDVTERVDDRLGRFEAVIRTEMPHADVKVADLEAKVDAAMERLNTMDQGLGAAFGALDSKLQSAFQLQGQQEIAVRRMAEAAGQDLEGAMQGSLANVDTNNPMVRQFYVWATKPVDEKWAAKHPFEAMLVQGGKMWFGQNVLPQLAGEGAAEGVTRYGVSKGDKIL